MRKLCVLGLLIVAVYSYLEFGIAFIKEVSLSANKDRQCEQRADPVRFSINKIIFSVPADIFDKKSLMQCDHGAYGSTSNCTKSHQNEKIFQNGEFLKIAGYCQSPEDTPFLVSGTKLSFSKLPTKGVHLKLQSKGRPEKTVILDELIVNGADKFALREYCREAGANNQLKMFGNPVIITCQKDERPAKYNINGRLCGFRGLIGKQVNIFQNMRFAERDIPQEYWPTYLAAIEQIITNYFLDIPKSEYPSICAQFEKK